VINQQSIPMRDATFEEYWQWGGATHTADIPVDLSDIGQRYVYWFDFTDDAGQTTTTPAPESGYYFDVYSGDFSWLEEAGNLRFGDWWSADTPWQWSKYPDRPDVEAWDDVHFITVYPSDDPSSERHSTPPAIGTNLSGEYPENTDAYLTLNPPMQCSEGAVLGLQHCTDTPQSFHGAIEEGWQMQCRADGGSWVVIDPVYAANNDNYGSEISPLGWTNGFGGTTDGVVSEVWDLSAYNGQTLEFRIRFASDSGGGSGDGVRIFGFMAAGMDPGTHTIPVEVREQSTAVGIDVAEVTVHAEGLCTVNDPPDAVMCTESDGTALLFPVDTGNHVVGVSAPGYYKEEQAVNVPMSGAGETMLIEVLPYTDDPDITEDCLVVYDDSSPAEGVDVKAVDNSGAEVGTATTDATGACQLVGPPVPWDIWMAANPEGSGGYHTTKFKSVDPTITPNTFILEPIQAPEVNATAVGNGEIVVWLFPPSNDLPTELVNEQITGLQENIEQLQESGARDEMVESLRNRLDALQEEAAPQGSKGGGNHPPLLGYRVRLDGVLLPEVFPVGKITLPKLQNGKEYMVEVAAEYGYGDEYLVFGTPQYLTPDAYQVTAEATTYSWIELRPDLGGPGTSTATYNDYPSVINDIGGTFTFFGQDYTSIRVWDNGLITFDPNLWSMDENNFSIPSTDDPNGVIAPYFLNLQTTYDTPETGYYWYDSVNNWFVIQWHAPEYDMWTASTFNVTDFEVILDLNNSNIVFQYNTTEDGWNSDALIGIEDPGGTIGWTYPANDLTDGSALVLNVGMPLYGSVTGTLLSNGTDPVPNAGVFVNDEREPRVMTSSDGSFELVLPVGTYDLAFRHPARIPSVESGVVVSDGTVNDLANIPMNVQSGSLSSTNLVFEYDLDNPAPMSQSVTIENTGYGELPFNVWAQVIFDPPPDMTPADPLPPMEDIERTYELVQPGSSDRSRLILPAIEETNSIEALWTNMLHLNATQKTSAMMYTFYEAVVATNTAGIVTTDNYEGTDYILFDTAGSYLGTAPIPSPAAPIYNDFGWDALEDVTFSVKENGDIIRFSPDFSTADIVGNVGFAARGCAYNWFTGDLYAYRRGIPALGEERRFVRYNLRNGSMQELRAPTEGYPYSIAFVPDDPDGRWIYAYAVMGNKGYIHRYDPHFDFWEATPRHVFDGDGDYGSAGGFETTNAFSGEITNIGTDGVSVLTPTRLDFITTYYDDSIAGTWIDVWEGVPPQAILGADPVVNTIANGESGTVNIVVNPYELDQLPVQPGDVVHGKVQLFADHWLDAPDIDVTITFTGDVGVDRTAGLPEKYQLHQNFPNPFNPTTTIQVDLVQPQQVSLIVYNIMGREVLRLADGEMMHAGYHQFSFDAAQLACGVYFVRVDAGPLQKLRKMVLMK
jgi:hypothetical protein